MCGRDSECAAEFSQRPVFPNNMKILNFLVPPGRVAPEWPPDLGHSRDSGLKSQLKKNCQGTPFPSFFCRLIGNMHSMKLFCFILFLKGVVGSCEVDAPGCKEVLQADADNEQALELLQMKSAKNAEAHEDVEEIDEVGNAAEDVEEDGNASEDLEEDASEDAALPMGEEHKSGKYCKSGRGTSCYSPRGWLGKIDKQKCNDKCGKGEKGCKFFFYGDGGHCGLCKQCDRTAFADGYNIYKKYVINYPVQNAICKEAHSSQKRLGKAKGCKNRSKKLGAVAYSYKNKQCRTWNKCSTTKKARGWTLKETPK